MKAARCVAIAVCSLAMVGCGGGDGGTAVVTLRSGEDTIAKGNVIVTDEDGETVAEAQADARGVAVLELEAGTYSVTARTPETTECDGETLEIDARAETEVTVRCEARV